MGWNTGGELMESVIQRLKRLSVLVPNGRGAIILLENVYRVLIEEFEKHDCDVLYECLGEDKTFDGVYRMLHPDEEPATEATHGKNCHCDSKDDPTCPTKRRG
jgi:hypothetical protein